MYYEKKFEGNEPICKISWETIVVNWDGTISPCPLDYNESHAVGDVHDDKLIDIWNSELFQKFRQCHLDHDFTWIEEQGELCSACNGRYFPDYDMRNLKKDIPVYLTRQATVHAQDLLDISEESLTEEQKYKNLLTEIAKLD